MGGQTLIQSPRLVSCYANHMISADSQEMVFWLPYLDKAFLVGKDLKNLGSYVDEAHALFSLFRFFFLNCFLFFFVSFFSSCSLSVFLSPFGSFHGCSDALKMLTGPRSGSLLLQRVRSTICQRKTEISP